MLWVLDDPISQRLNISRKEMATTLEEKIERARQRLRVGLRKQCLPNVSDAAIDTAEELLWQGSVAARSEQSPNGVIESPDAKTLALYASHAADTTILNETLLRARIHDSVRMGIGDVESIAQRARARSRGRNSTVPQTMDGAGTTAKGQLLLVVTYVSVWVLVLVVYVVERTKQ